MSLILKFFMVFLSFNQIMRNYEQFDNVSEVDEDIIDNVNFGKNIDEGIILYNNTLKLLKRKLE